MASCDKILRSVLVNIVVLSSQEQFETTEGAPTVQCSKRFGSLRTEQKSNLVLFTESEINHFSRIVSRAPIRIRLQKTPVTVYC